MVNASKEELKEVRNRNNPVKDATQLNSKVGVTDDYTCTKTKARLNELEDRREAKRLMEEVWDTL